MNSLWRGTWETRWRVASGLILFIYALLHFVNIGLGLISPDWMDAFQTARQTITRSLAGGLILYGALLAHAGLALWKLTLRRTLRMPIWEAVQLALGFCIPLLLATHIVFTRYAHEVYGVNDTYGYLIGLIWGTNSGRNQIVLLLIVWLHGCVGVHFWLRGQAWWRAAQPWMIALSVLIPAFALAGYLTEGRRITVQLGDPETRSALYAVFNWPSGETFGALIRLNSTVWYVILGLLCAATAIHFARKILIRARSVRIRYVDGPEVSSPKGMTLLEISRANGVPHTSLCGGRGRCTTCRVVVEDGGELLHPPSAAEMRSLKAVNAPPNTRLACQIRPTAPATVFRVFQPDGKRHRAHASQGQERRLAVLFLDMRGFTARTTGQLPYDVVFLLNRFFDAIVPAITQAGGTVDKYLGDGLMAVFETSDTTTSAKAGISAAQGISAALVQFNATLSQEESAPVAIGIGLHLGDVVLGEIGAAGHAPRTLIGDTVNAASRLEGQTKEQAVEVLISGAVLRAAGHDTEALEMMTLTLRGVAEPVDALALKSGGMIRQILDQHAAPASDAPAPAS